MSRAITEDPLDFIRNVGPATQRLQVRDAPQGEVRARERLLAVFDFHEQWFTEEDFCGCMFINASAEFSDPKSAPRLVAADHKLAILRFLCQLCRGCGFSRPEHIADQVNLLIEGSIVTAQVVGQVRDGGSDPGAAARLARDMARVIIQSAPVA